MLFSVLLQSDKTWVKVDFAFCPCIKKMIFLCELWSIDECINIDNLCIYIWKSFTGIKSKAGNLMNLSDKTKMFRPIHSKDQAAGYLLQGNTFTLLLSFVDISWIFFPTFPISSSRHYRLQFSARGVEVQIYYTTLCYFGTKTQSCTRHSYNMIQINAITAGAEVALIPLTLSLFKMQCRDQIKRPACSGSLKGQTAETKAISESRAEVRRFPGERATIWNPASLLTAGHLTWNDQITNICSEVWLGCIHTADISAQFIARIRFFV